MAWFSRGGFAMFSFLGMLFLSRVPSALGFSIIPPLSTRTNYYNQKQPSVLFASSSIADKTDPFDILNLTPSPNLDKKEIKRAYKRMALRFHPDVVTTKNSTPDEKKRANDDFARINWAYETLSGKNNNQEDSSATSSSNAGYTPPHRRSGAYTSSSTKRTTTSATPGASTNWEDYMPKYNEEDYDAGGDSFGAIFSDLLTGAAMGAAGVASGGGGGVLRDLVEFLERNVDGYSGGAQDDAQLTLLLQTGTVEEIGMEMDDTELVVQQLSSKLQNLQQEYMTVSEQAKQTVRYLERLELEEAAEEIQARQKVSEGYLKKARARLVKLQTRYKQLIVNGDNDFDIGRGSRQSSSSWDSNPTGTTRDTVGTDYSRGKEDDDDEAWKHEGFGSSGRSRGSRRRRSSRARRTTAASSTNTSNDFGKHSSQQQPRTPESPRQTTSRSTTTSTGTSRSTTTTGSSRGATTTGSRTSASSPPEPWTPPVPPHRRTSTTSQAQADKRRLRQLKVEEDFDQLKKDLGL